MKRLIVPFSFLVAWSAFAQESHDWRTVNGVAVDLGPVHQWLVDRQGERPLKHWKQLRLVEMKGTLAGWDNCQVKTESGADTELLLANLPADVKAFFQSLNRQHTEIVRLREVIVRDTQQIRLLEAKTPVAAYGDINYVNSVMSQRRQLETWKANVETAREQLGELQISYDLKVQQAGERLAVLAMFSGRKYSNLEVWDCGKPGKK